MRSYDIEAERNLLALRLNPRSAAQQAYYVCVEDSILYRKEGQAVTITPSLTNGVTVLTISAGLAGSSNKDYYFPYIPGTVGKVVVADADVKAGVLAVTGGMNGCALEVRYGDGYVFYHDANSEHRGDMDDGEVLWRTEPDEDWGKGRGKLPPGTTKERYPLVQFICVYQEGMWHVVSWGIFTDGSKTPVGVWSLVGPTYRGNFNRSHTCRFIPHTCP
jgi:hypothetical protein